MMALVTRARANVSGPSWVTNEACWPWPATSTKASVPIRPAITQVKVDTLRGLSARWNGSALCWA